MKGVVMRMLLVDDSVTMRRIQKTQLEALGITDVKEAGNGQEGYDMLVQSMPVDVVLLDWNMPVMDGFTLLKKLRSEPAFKNVKIVMCTSEAEKQKVLTALQAGANNYIIKPFTPEALKEKLGL
jgi:two-component system chemotaxis response regulator CheY